MVSLRLTGAVIVCKKFSNAVIKATPAFPGRSIWYNKDSWGGYRVISRKAIEHLKSAIFSKDLEAQSDHEAISKMLDLLRSHPQVSNFELFAADVFDRQQTDPPLFPGGVAFPHARTDGVAALVMAVATCREQIQFGDVSVRLIFLVGVPKRAGGDYLELISFLARQIRRDPAMERLTGAEDMPGFIARFVDPA
ncbi:MAG TPA: PTS sugar transporter subunit IIA [Chthoniobacterales bacterium]|jgi:mannitol/fructose-specific phosphotransferase system IIA component (Ntr-type)